MQPFDEMPPQNPTDQEIDAAYIDKLLSGDITPQKPAQAPIPSPLPPEEKPPEEASPAASQDPPPRLMGRKLLLTAAFWGLLAVAAVLLLLFAKGTPEPSPSTPPETTTISTTPPQTTQTQAPVVIPAIPIVVECENYPASYFLEESYQCHISSADMVFSVNLPLLEPFCDGAKAINQQIRETFQPIIDQAVQAHESQTPYSVRSIHYQIHDFTNKNILSILITEEDALGLKQYYTYHLDVSTGQVAETPARIRYLTDLSYPEYVMRATYTLADHFRDYSLVNKEWLTELEYSPEALVGLELLPETADSFTLVNLYAFSFPTLTIPALRIPFDPYAQDARYDGGVQTAYHWFFGRISSGSDEDPGAFASPLFLSAFYADPQEFLTYLSQEDADAVTNVTFAMTLSLSSESLETVWELCLPYAQGDTEKAALALQKTCSDKLPETHISHLQDIPDVSGAVYEPGAIFVEPGYSGYAKWNVSGTWEDISIELPLLEPFCEGAKEINAAIKSTFQPIIDDVKQTAALQASSGYWKIDYEIYQSSDFLSIVISTSKRAYDTVFYTIFNLDLSSGEFLDQQEMIRRFTGMSYPEFLLQANHTVVNHLRKAYPQESEEVTNWLSKLETDVWVMNGHQLFLDHEGTLYLANHSVRSSWAGSQIPVQIPFDPNACEKEWDDRELESYRWLFSIRADGAYAPTMGNILRDVFFPDPERFLRYLSGSEYWLADTAYMITCDMEQENVTLLRELCMQYLSRSDTAPAARAILDSIEKYAEIY